MLAESGWALFAQVGCIATYGPNLQDAYRHLAVYADRILTCAELWVANSCSGEHGRPQSLACLDRIMG